MYLNELPKISVVIPSFNKAVFIEDAIRSVIAQDYPKFEVIIYDNCSTDGTQEILQRYPFIDAVVEPDKGQCDALNKGFARAKGEIIGWLNADDYFLPGVFERVAHHFARHRETDVIYGDYYWVDTDGKFRRELRLLNFNLSMSIYCGMNIPCTLAFFQKRIFKEGFYLDTSFHYIMDMEFLTRLGKAGKKIVHLPGMYFGCFRMYDKNVGTKYKLMQGQEREEEWRRHLKEHYRFRDLYGPVASYLAQGRFFYFLMKRYWRMRMIVAKGIRGLYFSKIKYWFNKPETRLIEIIKL